MTLADIGAGNADLGAEAEIRRVLHEHDGDASWLGEETGAHAGTSTRSFVSYATRKRSRSQLCHFGVVHGWIAPSRNVWSLLGITRSISMPTEPPPMTNKVPLVWMVCWMVCPGFLYFSTNSMERLKKSKPIRVGSPPCHAMFTSVPG